jgi:hypothetical protein
MGDKYGQLHPCAFALAMGIIWGLGTFIMAVVAMHTGYGSSFVSGLGSLYIGYEASYLGSVIGLAWGFFDAAVFGFLLAWLYNVINRKAPCCKDK